MWILQIDDDEDDLEIFGAAVKHFDSTHKYSGFTTMEAALAFLDADGVIPEVIFLDINMPKHSGFDCFAIFKQNSRFAHTRFIFLSTTINKKEIPQGCDFMLKQHSVKNYAALLKTFLPPPFDDISYKNFNLNIDNLATCCR